MAAPPSPPSSPFPDIRVLLPHALAAESPLHAALRALAAPHSSVCIVLDFDGTLAPIVSDPAAAAPSTACRDLLTRLSSSPRATVALLSGRAVATLRARVGLSPAVALRVAWAGSHGGACDGAGAVRGWGPSPRAREALSRVRADLEVTLAAAAPGAVLEDNVLALSAHWRQCGDGGTAAAAAVDAAKTGSGGARTERRRRRAAGYARKNAVCCRQRLAG